MAKKIKRAQTGIPGLDGLIEGGLPAGSVNILAGHCGTGRSSFAMQFLYNGAKNNEPGIYVCLENEPEEVLENMSIFDWDLEDQIRQKKLLVIKPEFHKFENLKQIIEDEIDRSGAKRLVIDQFSLITAYFDNVYNVRKALSDLTRKMTKLECTALIITDIKEGEDTFSSTGFEEFAVSGVIALDLIVKKDSSSFVRTLMLRKMQKTNHSLKLVPFEISNDGISLYPDTEVF